MIVRDADSPTGARATRLRFDRYVLDLDRGCLFHGESEIPLRPKTFAVLRYLTENPGRLVSKDELFAAVWPNVAVTDDALVQSVGELRRAFGDDGARLIKTIPRRGYRLEAGVSVVSPTESLAQPVRTAESSLPVPPASPARSRVVMKSVFAAAVALVCALWIGGTGWQFPGWDNHAETRMPQIAAKPAIAIMPLVHQRDDATRDYFADGLTQDIINLLGRFSALTVMSWKAVLPYKGKTANPGEIGRSLAVGYLVEGGVRENGDRVRVTAQLVDTRQGQVLWSGRFDEALADVFAVQDRIATEIVRVLAIRLTQIEQQRVFAKPTANLQAYDYVLRARPALQHPTRAGNAEARTLLRRALEFDRGYAAAYSALADTYYTATSMGWSESPTVALDSAEELATKALSLDHADVRARVILGRIHIFHRRYNEAAMELDRAIAINPNDASGLAGRGNILMWLGQTDAAIEALEQAQRIDPDLNAIDRFALSLAYYLKRRYDAAIEQAQRNLRGIAGANFSRALLAAAYAQQNRAEDAARVAEDVRRFDPTYDAQAYGTKFVSAADLAHVREGLRKAGLYPPGTGPVP